MKLSRRTLLAAVTLGLCVSGPPTEAQSEKKAQRIGWLAPAPNRGNLDAFRSGLRTFGYIEGKNVIIEQQYADEPARPLAEAAMELSRRDLDVIVTDGSAATLALKQAAASTPVVFVSGDPVALGLVPSLSRPGGTMTGFAILAAELNVKRIELLREVLPQASRIGVLHERRQRRILAPIEEGARKLGFQVIRLEARGAADMEEIFATAMKERVGGLMPVASALFHAEKQRLVDLSTRHRLPAIYESRAFTEVGGLMSYGPDMVDVFRRVGAYVHRILTGTRPADLPVEQPTTFELVINQKTASALGLTIPRSLLLQATNVIE